MALKPQSALKPAPAPAPAKDEPLKPISITSRVAELEHDLAAVSELLGKCLGEPFKTQADEIVKKRQVS